MNSTEINLLAAAPSSHQDISLLLEKITQLRREVDEAWLIGNTFLVLFMQCGFALLEAGCGRLQNVGSIIWKNFGDFLCVGFFYYLIGFSFSFAPSKSGFIGERNLLPAEVSLSYWFFQFAFAGAASTICSGCLLERTRLSSYLILTTIVGGFIYPVVCHWIWSTSGWLSISSLNLPLSVGALDYAGAGPVHVVGGCAGFVGSLFVGPRRGVIGADGKIVGFPGHSAVMRAIGTFILWFGFYGFNCGSTMSVTGGGYKTASLIAINSTLSGSLGALSSLLGEYFLARKLNLDAMLNGSLAGLVAVTAGCAFYSPHWGAFTGFVSGLIYLFGEKLLRRFKIDDPVGAIPVHLFGGCWGILTTGLFADGILMPQYRGAFFGNPKQLLIQFIELIVIVSWACSLAYLALIVIEKLVGFRVEIHEEDQGVDTGIGVSAFPELQEVKQTLEEQTGFERIINAHNHRLLWVFHAYLQNESGPENLDFLIAIHAFEKFVAERRTVSHNLTGKRHSFMPSASQQTDINKRFRALVELYVKNNDKIALSDHQRDFLLGFYNVGQTPPYGVFDGAKDDLTNLLKSGVFRRFWRDYQSAREERRHKKIKEDKKSAISDKSSQGKSSREKDFNFWQLAFGYSDTSGPSRRSSMFETGPRHEEASEEKSNGLKARSTSSSSNHTPVNFKVQENGMVIWKGVDDMLAQRRKDTAKSAQVAGNAPEKSHKSNHSQKEEPEDGASPKPSGTSTEILPI